MESQFIERLLRETLNLSNMGSSVGLGLLFHKILFVHKRDTRTIMESFLRSENIKITSSSWVARCKLNM